MRPTPRPRPSTPPPWPARKAARARDYLKKRGLTPEIIRAFQLGYAVDEWDALRRHFQNRGISLDLAQDVGLLAPRDRGGFYDRFRGRIMFPIFDRQSRVIAFGGRIIGDGEPKYLNSPETLLYSKGRTLYGLPQAAEALRATGVALVVEGYLDLIALQVQGIGNVLATLGTALTREQVRLLKAVADKVVLVYDGDAAGAKAMKRAFPLFAQENLAVQGLAAAGGAGPGQLRPGPRGGAVPHRLGRGPPLVQLPPGRPHYHPRPGYRRPGADFGGTAPLRPGPDGPGGTGPVAQGHQRAAWGWMRRRCVKASPPWPPFRPPGWTRHRNIVVDQEKKLLRWVLGHPEAVAPEELEEWTEEFENPELKGLLELIITCYREHGRLDHGLLVQQATGETQRQHICALTLEEDDSRRSLRGIFWPTTGAAILK